MMKVFQNVARQMKVTLEDGIYHLRFDLAGTKARKSRPER